MEKGEIVKSGEGFIDRSKVRILLCDNDGKSAEEVFTLLCKCSYQVISARSPRQVIDALNAEGPDIDIILSEVDLPMSKGFKMLKYIMRDKELRRIPVIMMSSKDEVSIVVKCLKFGAADYLVKPLRTNELLNLWTHMWRRRRMLGLAEKNILSYDFDLVISEPSDPNTTSTTLFSDDTDDKSRKSVNLETCHFTQLEDECFQPNAATTAASVETTVVTRSGYQPDVPRTNGQRIGQISSFPKKSELKIGESSAFFTYVKSSMLKSNGQSTSSIQEYVPQQLRMEEKTSPLGDCVEIDARIQVNGDVVEKQSQGDDYPSSNSVPDSYSMERSCTPPLSLEFPQHRNSNMEFSQVHMHPRSEAQHDVSSFHAQTAYPYYISGAMNQAMIPSTQMYQKNMQDLHNHANPTMLHQYNHIPQYSPHMHGMASYPFYPMSMCLQPGQMPTPHPWPSFGSSSTAEGKVSKVDRREAALMKFRQKRKERCFDKKIRYVNRKRLAERRPRVRGQFVRKVNGVNVDLNGQPASADEDDDEEEEDEDEQ